MIETPYAVLRRALGEHERWHPDWGQNLEVLRTDTTTVYAAHPETIGSGDLTELQQLAAAGWNVNIDSRRLNRLRIRLWQ